MLTNKKAMLRSMESVGRKLLGWCIAGSLLLPLFKPQLSHAWIVLMPLGLAGLLVSTWAKNKLVE